MHPIKDIGIRGRNRLPVMVGTEDGDCGLACLAMIGRRYGHDVDLNGLRQRFPLSIAGTNLRGLMDIADRLGFGARPVKVGLEMLNKLKGPAILHWNLNHFVVLAKVSPNSIIIHDPAVGRRRLTFEEASNHFTGVALELTPAPNFQSITEKRPTKISTLWSKVTGFWSSLLQVLLLTLTFQAVVFAAPFYLQLTVDESVARSDADLLSILALSFGFLVVVQAAIQGLRGYALQTLGFMLSYQIVGNIVRHLLRLPTSFFEKRHVGDILSRIQSTQPIQDAMTQGVATALIDGGMAIFALGILFYYSGTLTAIVLIGLTLSIIVTFAFYPIVRRRSEEALLIGAKEQSHLIESVRASRTIKIMGAESERESRWRNLFADATNARLSVGVYRVSQDALQRLIAGLQHIIVVYLAARMIISGSGFSVGMLFAYTSFSLIFTDRILALINQAMQFRLLSLHLERIGDIVHAERESSSNENPIVETGSGALALQEVTFRYGAGDHPVLSDASLIIAPGEYLAITGPSGGGKSTLLKLLLGLYEPERGELLIGGEKADPERSREWRKNAGVVTQDDQLLSGTLAENIAFFDPEMDMTRVYHAAERAQIHEDIMRMPLRYLTTIGDMGAALSGGQRQRVLIARALYRDPDILILDEGTANLDPETEEAIANLLSSMKITRIVVAHRPALIERADRRVVVYGGKVHNIKQSE